MTRQSDGLAESIRQRVEKHAKALVLEIDANLRRSGTGTPVDTGHARSNWVPSVAMPFTGIAQGEGPHNAGVSAVLAFKLADGGLYLSNNVPYVRRLNLGSSRQAPAGFIERAIDDAMAKIRTKFVDVTIDVTTKGAGTFSDAAGGFAAEGIADAYSPFGG